jgi:2-C-methyl-D-erythritol 2,4-cyclodiphosphate synthase
LTDLRVGLGYDLHPFVDGRPLVLGGVEILPTRGLAGHSDGDPLSHALIDALLGAAGQGDIGELFPPGDERYRGAYSLDLLRSVATRLQGEGWRVINVDTAIIAQEPRLAPHRAGIRTAVAGALQVA